MKIELEIDDALYKECQKKQIDIKTFLEVTLYDYLYGIKKRHEIIFDITLFNEFSAWLFSRISKETAERYIRLVKPFLGKKITENTIRSHFEESTNKKNLAKAIRNLVNFLYESGRIQRDTVEELKRAAPIPKCKSDLTIPSDEDIREAFVYFSTLRPELYLTAKLILYSGARARHTLKMLNNFDKRKLTILDGFSRYNLSILTKTKRACYIYFPTFLTPPGTIKVTENMVKTNINYHTSSGKVVSPKYIRKWVNNVMVDVGVDKDVRNFILGRTGELSKSIEVEHYLEMTKYADRDYPKIMREIKKRVKI